MPGESSRARTWASSATLIPGLRVAPNATSWAFASFSSPAAARAKNSVSLGIAPGQPPSMKPTPSSSSRRATASLSLTEYEMPSRWAPSRRVVSKTWNASRSMVPLQQKTPWPEGVGGQRAVSASDASALADNDRRCGHGPNHATPAPRSASPLVLGSPRPADAPEPGSPITRAALGPADHPMRSHAVVGDPGAHRTALIEPVRSPCVAHALRTAPMGLAGASKRAV